MWSKHAVHRPVPYRDLKPRKPYRAVVVHTNGGGDHDIPDDTSLYNWWVGKANAGSKVGAHFQVMTSGKAEQYVDTDLVVAHAFDANYFAVGIEVEDDGMPSLPINKAQMDTIVRICQELKVPAQALAIGPAHGGGLASEVPLLERERPQLSWPRPGEPGQDHPHSEAEGGTHDQGRSRCPHHRTFEGRPSP